MDIPSLIADFQDQLHDIEHSEWDIIKQSRKDIVICQKTLSDLKKEVVKNKFDSIDKEIQFFKTSKQIPLSNLIYYLECYTFEMQLPKIGKKKQQKFVAKTKNRIQEFFTRHIDFVNYIEQKQTYLDTWYFTRKYTDELRIIPTQDYAFDMEFNTSHDVLLGKLQAYKRFIIYLENRFNNQKQPQDLESLSKQYNLKWTSTKVALTELIYAPIPIME